jgi:hypothetical protein
LGLGSAIGALVTRESRAKSKTDEALVERAKTGEFRQLLLQVILPVLADPSIPDEQVGAVLRNTAFPDIRRSIQRFYVLTWEFMGWESNTPERAAVGCRASWAGSPSTMLVLATTVMIFRWVPLAGGRGPALSTRCPGAVLARCMVARQKSRQRLPWTCTDS